MSNYLRYYELLVGYPETYKLVNPEYPSLDASSESETSLSFSPEPLNFMAIEAEEGKGVSIEKNQITASILGNVESKGSNGRSCNIKVYNLSDDTAQSLLSSNLKVILKAGYKEDYDQDNLPVVFSGQIKKSRRVLNGNENIVELTCVDGYTPSNAIKVSHTLKTTEDKTVTIYDIVDYLVSVWRKNGISSTKTSINFDTLPTDRVNNPAFFRAGWVGEGYLRDIMDDICDSYGYQWYIVNATLYIQPKSDNRVRELFELDTSLIKSIKDGSQDSTVDSNQTSKSRLNIVTLLNGDITEGKLVKIGSQASARSGQDDYFGVYKVISVKHTLDYRGSSWDTELECEKL